MYISISLVIFYRRRLVSASPPRRKGNRVGRTTATNKRQVSPPITTKKACGPAKALTVTSSRSSSQGSLCRVDFEFSDLESELVDDDDNDDHVPRPSPSDESISVHSSIEKSRKLGKLYKFIIFYCDCLSLQ